MATSSTLVSNGNGHAATANGTATVSPLRALKQRLSWAIKGKPKKKKPSIDVVMEEIELLAKQPQIEYDRLCAIRRDKCVAVKQPLVLISQIQRSGGTLLSQLFDKHPQCHAHPYELYIGFPKKLHWPTLDMQAGPESWFRTLFEKPVLKSFKEGYVKYGQGLIDDEYDVFPFVFLPSLQKALFMQQVAAHPITTARDVFDCYLTSYFNAWLDNQNLYGEAKKYVTAFVPRMGMGGDNLERFFGTYPDGKLISIVRDPRSWYVSARKHKEKLYGPIDQAMDLWLESTRAITEARRRYAASAYVMTFEALVGDTEGTMRSLASWLGIDFTSSLLMPTFNGFPIKADSSFKVQSYGVIKDPLERYKKALTSDELRFIEGRTRAVHAEALELAQAR